MVLEIFEPFVFVDGAGNKICRQTVCIWKDNLIGQLQSTGFVPVDVTAIISAIKKLFRAGIIVIRTILLLK